MSLNIKNDSAHRMATELASLRGTARSQAVTGAVHDNLEREKRRRT